MELCKTENIITGNVRYYKDGIRISENKYRFLLDYNFANSFNTISKGNFRKHFVLFSKNKQR